MLAMKKGISNIVSVMVIIFVVMLAAITAGVYANLFIKKSLEFSPLPCLEMQTRNIIEIQKTCYNSNNEIELTLRRNFDNVKIENLNFVLEGNEIDNFACGKICGDCEILQEGETKKYLLQVENANQKKDVKVYFESCLLSEKNVVTC